MGITHFFSWFKKNHSEYMTGMRKNDTFADIGVNIDTLLIDMNGVFHGSTQKIYQYGNCKPNPRLLKKGKPPPHGLTAQLAVFADVCKTVEHLFKITKPTKRLILCVDGPAPISKQNQQRQRRFKSAKEKASGKFFDSNCLTPGTKFMDYLSKYIDWYIRKRITEDRDWQNIQVIFSNEKAAGEGEQKCLKIGTEILLWNGLIEKVENIKVGQKLIGDDGTSRTVTDILTGEDEMYEIIQEGAENYTVNKNHILSLTFQVAELWFMDKSWVVGWVDRDTSKYTLDYFPTQEEAICFKERVSIGNVLDISVTEYMELPEELRNKLHGYRCKRVHWPKKDVKFNPYFVGLQFDNIPREYIINDSFTRMKVLAGIIDSSGVVKDNKVCVTKSCDRVLYLARSLGFCANKNEADEIVISGRDFQEIPTLRLKCPNSEPGLTTPISIRPVGKDKYYGFNTDGNHRFLLGDFTVTHNCIQYIRFHGKKNETYCIHGMDADIIMLSMGTHMPKFYILRDEVYDKSLEYYYIDIGSSRKRLAGRLAWKSDKHEFNPRSAINDFVFLCFMVGNDFLPHIPSLEIIENGIELILAKREKVGG